MVTTCPVCHELVHISCGYIARHGSYSHGLFGTCAGSGQRVISDVSCCG